MKGRVKRRGIRIVVRTSSKAARKSLAVSTPDNLVYMYGKLSEAIGILITNHGDVRNRVWVASPKIFMVHAGGLPSSLHNDIMWIHAQMTRYPANDVHKTSIQATYHRTRNVTAGKIAARLWRLYHEMQSELESRKQV